MARRKHRPRLHNLASGGDGGKKPPDRNKDSPREHYISDDATRRRAYLMLGVRPKDHGCPNCWQDVSETHRRNWRHCSQPCPACPLNKQHRGRHCPHLARLEFDPSWWQSHMEMDHPRYMTDSRDSRGFRTQSGSTDNRWPSSTLETALQVDRQAHIRHARSRSPQEGTYSDRHRSPLRRYSSDDYFRAPNSGHPHNNHPSSDSIAVKAEPEVKMSDSRPDSTSDHVRLLDHVSIDDRLSRLERQLEQQALEHQRYQQFVVIWIYNGQHPDNPVELPAELQPFLSTHLAVLEELNRFAQQRQAPDN
ncbi:hypothetical protein N0V90_011675 [Kalmusia sp. IMI 367209]|nr:hypothetical protein N0V90_011675 [Kalmusia sp. IMI 367209]